MTITKEFLLDRFTYDREAGKLYYRKISPYNWKASIGDEVGNIGGDGYRRIKIHGKYYKVHRLIWFIEHGWWPDQIDHSNGDPLDNRIENLRPATASQQGANRPGSGKNWKGVYRTKPRRWIARLEHNGKAPSLGTYDCPAAASFAYQIAEDKLHGEYSYHRRKVK